MGDDDKDKNARTAEPFSVDDEDDEIQETVVSRPPDQLLAKMRDQLAKQGHARIPSAVDEEEARLDSEAPTKIGPSSAPAIAIPKASGTPTSAEEARAHEKPTARPPPPTEPEPEATTEPVPVRRESGREPAAAGPPPAIGILLLFVVTAAVLAALTH